MKYVKQSRHLKEALSITWLLVCKVRDHEANCSAAKLSSMSSGGGVKFEAVPGPPESSDFYKNPDPVEVTFKVRPEILTANLSAFKRILT
ncbi:uncharacterized [Tachysurus ichikawai]